jgi:hypothetical protein
VASIGLAYNAKIYSGGGNGEQEHKGNRFINPQYKNASNNPYRNYMAIVYGNVVKDDYITLPRGIRIIQLHTDTNSKLQPSYLGKITSLMFNNLDPTLQNTYYLNNLLPESHRWYIYSGNMDETFDGNFKNKKCFNMKINKIQNIKFADVNKANMISSNVRTGVYKLPIRAQIMEQNVSNNSVKEVISNNALKDFYDKMSKDLAKDNNGLELAFSSPNLINVYNSMHTNKLSVVINPDYIVSPNDFAVAKSMPNDLRTLLEQIKNINKFDKEEQLITIIMIVYTDDGILKYNDCPILLDDYVNSEKNFLTKNSRECEKTFVEYDLERMNDTNNELICNYAYADTCDKCNLDTSFIVKNIMPLQYNSKKRIEINSGNNLMGIMPIGNNLAVNNPKIKDDKQNLKNMMTDFLNKYFFEHEADMAFVKIIYSTFDTAIAEYIKNNNLSPNTILFVYKGGNLVRYIYKTLINHYSITIFEKYNNTHKEYFEKSDLDFNLYINPYLVDSAKYEKVYEDMTLLSYYILSNLREVFKTNRQYFFTYHKLSNNEKVNLLEKLLQTFQGSRDFQDTNNTLLYNKSVKAVFFGNLNTNIKEEMNNVSNLSDTDVISGENITGKKYDFDMKRKYANDPSNLIIDTIENNIPPSNYVISINRSIDYQNENKDQVKFNLVRMKVNCNVILEEKKNNIAKYYKTGVAGELIDISIIHKNTFNVKKFFDNANDYITHYTDINKKTAINGTSLKYLMIDLKMILFVLGKPWSDNKYEKRVRRLVFLIFVNELIEINKVNMVDRLVNYQNMIFLLNDSLNEGKRFDLANRKNKDDKTFFDNDRFKSYSILLKDDLYDKMGNLIDNNNNPQNKELVDFLIVFINEIRTVILIILEIVKTYTNDKRKLNDYSTIA